MHGNNAACRNFIVERHPIVGNYKKNEFFNVYLFNDMCRSDSVI